MLAEFAPPSIEGLDEQGLVGSEAPVDSVLQVLDHFVIGNHFFFFFFFLLLPSCSLLLPDYFSALSVYLWKFCEIYT